MDSEDIYENVECRIIEDTFGPPTQSNGQDEGKDGKHSKQKITLKDGKHSKQKITLNQKWCRR